VGIVDAFAAAHSNPASMKCIAIAVDAMERWNLLQQGAAQSTFSFWLLYEGGHLRFRFSRTLV
jgi:hypothetical protein